MNLVSMKLTPKEAKEEATEMSAMPDKPEYPCGTMVSLDDATLKKLGIVGTPALGTKMSMTAQVEVCAASSHMTQTDAETSVTLQITDMALDASSARGAADRLYGAKK